MTKKRFEALVGSYRGPLHAHCYRMLGSFTDAEDVLQEVLLRAWHGLASFEGRSSLRAWLYRIATNTCRNAIESRSRRILPVDRPPTADRELSDGPSEEIAWRTFLGAGALVLTRISAEGNYRDDLFPGLFLFGLGLGAGTVAASVAALAGAAEGGFGVAAGVNTAAFQIGGALGAAVVTTVGASGALDAHDVHALTAGFQSGFATCALFAGAGALIALTLLRSPRQQP